MSHKSKTSEVHVVVAHPAYERMYSTPSVFSDEDQSRIFTHLYEQYERKIYKHVYHLLSNHHDAEDATQEVFLRMHKKWNILYDHDNLLPWLYLVATNLSIDMLRQRLHFSLYTHITDGYQYDEDILRNANTSMLREEYTSDGSISSVAEKEHIRLTFDHMSLRDAQVLFLSAIKDQPYQEIATRIGISPSAAAACITRAKKKFLKEYQRILKENVEFEREYHDNDAACERFVSRFWVARLSQYNDTPLVADETEFV